MGLFDLFTSSSDKDVGTKVLRGYFNEAVKYPDFKYKDFNAWVNWIESFDKGFVESIGNLVKSNYRSTTVADAVKRASDLANKSEGRSRTSDIVMAAGGKGDTIVWSAAIPEIAKETAKDIVEATPYLKYVGFAALAIGALWLAGQYQMTRRLILGNPKR